MRCRKAYICFLILILVPGKKGSVRAIESIGIKAGLNLSTISGIAFSNTSYRKTLTIGGFIRLRQSDRFSIQLCALYSQKGVLAKTSSGFSENAKIALDYIECPVLGQMTVYENGDLSLGLNVGPDLAWNINSKLTEPDGTEIPIDLSSDLDLGFIVGLAIDFKVGQRQFTLEPHYYHGLKEIATRWKNRAIVLLAGISF